MRKKKIARVEGARMFFLGKLVFFGFVFFAVISFGVFPSSVQALSGGCNLTGRDWNICFRPILDRVPTGSKAELEFAIGPRNEVHGHSNGFAYYGCKTESRPNNPDWPSAPNQITIPAVSRGLLLGWIYGDREVTIKKGLNSFTLICCETPDCSYNVRYFATVVGEGDGPVGGGGGGGSDRNTCGYPSTQTFPGAGPGGANGENLSKICKNAEDSAKAAISAKMDGAERVGWTWSCGTASCSAIAQGKCIQSAAQAATLPGARCAWGKSTSGNPWSCTGGGVTANNCTIGAGSGGATPPPGGGGGGGSACGPANGQDFTSQPTSGLCASGSPTSGPTHEPTCTSPGGPGGRCAHWFWSCGSASCSAWDVSGMVGGGESGCTPNCSCASNTCTGQTCSNGCGGTCSGTKSCSTTAGHCGSLNGSVIYGPTDLAHLSPPSGEDAKNMCTKVSVQTQPIFYDTCPAGQSGPNGLCTHWEWTCRPGIDPVNIENCLVWVDPSTSTTTCSSLGGSCKTSCSSTETSQGQTNCTSGQSCCVFLSNVGTIKIAGFCGNAAKHYENTETAFSGSFCYTGIQEPVNPAFPPTDGSSQWTCKGMTGGMDSSTCVATRGSSGGGGGGGTPSSCSVYSLSSSIPDGYGPPFNQLSSAKESTLSVTCSTTGAIATAGSQATYTYKSGFVSENGQWQKIDFSGTPDTNNAGWFKGSALSNLPAAPALGQNYVIAFVCQYQGGAWKCGCKDSACTQNYWTIQAYERSLMTTND